MAKHTTKKQKPTQDDSSNHQWEHESRDQMSALIEKLRAIPRRYDPEIPDGEYIMAVDLDAAIAASIEVPPDASETADKDSER